MLLTPVNLPCECGHECPDLPVTVVTDDLVTIIKLDDADLVAAHYESDDEAAESHAAYTNPKVLGTLINLYQDIMDLQGGGE